MAENSSGRGEPQLVELLEPLATYEWFTESLLPEVRFIRSNQGTSRIPTTYEPSIVIIIQGRKIGYLGDETYIYDPSNYLVLSVPLPFECETIASPEEPLLGLSIRITPAIISELLVEMDDQRPLSKQVSRGVYATPLTTELIDAVARLLKALSQPREGKILGPLIVREVIYRVLCGEQGAALRGLSARHSHFHQISKVLKTMHAEYDREFDVGTLASETGMSSSTFHNNFKAVTAASPLQYLKNIRLQKAKMLMVLDGLNASTAASRVGYASASQFSREFKRYFGSAPSVETAKIKSMGIQTM